MYTLKRESILHFISIDLLNDVWLIIVNIFVAYQIYKAFAYCTSPNYDTKAIGYRMTIADCYESCKDAALFHYHISGGSRALCQAIGCFCVCFMKSDADGGCVTLSHKGCDLFKVGG